ncbi:hypothetical protein J7K43_08510 [Candidatus Calescamantes bacterium]|nr:hypothetical protein [Candidatus Calescamantes bacterium]
MNKTEKEKNLATKFDLERVENTLSKRIDEVESTLSTIINEVEDTLNRRIDKVENTLNRRIDEVERTLNERINEVEKTLSEKIEENSKRIDKVAIQVVKNSEAINRMVTKEEFSEFKEEVLLGQDRIITILERLDQERIFTAEWIRRVEADVEKNKREIEKIKKKLAFS